MMVSNVAVAIEQPVGGFLNPNAMHLSSLETEEELYPRELENITGGEVGTTVDYLTRFLISDNLEDSFHISLKGAKLANMESIAEDLLNRIKGIDKESVEAAVRLVAFDVFVRNPIQILFGGWNPPGEISEESVHNIQVMVTRCLLLFKEYGPVKDYNLVFPGAYTKNVDSGDADYMTSDTIWDIKTTTRSLRITDTFQVLLYYLLSQHSNDDKYKSIMNIGIYNPRLNKKYIIGINEIDSRITGYINKYIIGYENEEATFNDLIKAIDERPKYPHYNRKRGTEVLLKQLVNLDCTDIEKIIIIRLSRLEYVRLDLGRYIETNNIKTFEEAYKKELELLCKYHTPPKPVFFLKDIYSEIHKKYKSG
jgi:hypothetical protein